MELGVLQTIDVALRAGNGIHRPTISSTVHMTRKKNNAFHFILCLTLV